MPEVLYDAHPSLIRMKPIATSITIIAILFGIALAVGGAGVLGQEVSEQTGKFIQIGGLALAVLACMTLLTWWLGTRTDHLVVKTDEIVWTHGIFNKQYTEISMSSVRTVRVEQNLIERMLNVGKITIFTAGDNPELEVGGMPDPDEIRELVKAQGSGETPAA